MHCLQDGGELVSSVLLPFLYCLVMYFLCTTPECLHMRTTKAKENTVRYIFLHKAKAKQDLSRSCSGLFSKVKLLVACRLALSL